MTKFYRAILFVSLFLISGLFFLLNNYYLLSVSLSASIFFFFFLILNEGSIPFSMIISFSIVTFVFIGLSVFGEILKFFIDKLSFTNEFLTKLQQRTSYVLTTTSFKQAYFTLSVVTLIICGLIVNIMYKNKSIPFVITSIILIFISQFMVTSSIKTNYIELVSSKIKAPIRIIHLSDTHNEDYFLKESNLLVDKLRNENPDLIFISGDMFDERGDFKNSITLINKIKDIAPIYYVRGNHELFTPNYDDKIETLKSLGVNYLADDFSVVNINGNEIIISGLVDPLGSSIPIDRRIETLEDSLPNNNSLKLLLSHRPEKYPIYKESNFDYVFSGHAHGGQIRIPFLVNGLFAPHQGTFPKYAGGIYNLSEERYLLVSRGLKITGPPRIFNPPEITVLNIIPK